MSQDSTEHVGPAGDHQQLDENTATAKQQQQQQPAHGAEAAQEATQPVQARTYYANVDTGVVRTSTGGAPAPTSCQVVLKTLFFVAMLLSPTTHLHPSPKHSQNSPCFGVLSLTSSRHTQGVSGEEEGLQRAQSSGVRWSEDDFDPVGKVGSTAQYNEDRAEHQEQKKKICYRVCGPEAWF